MNNLIKSIEMDIVNNCLKDDDFLFEYWNGFRSDLEVAKNFKDIVFCVREFIEYCFDIELDLIREDYPIMFELFSDYDIKDRLQELIVFNENDEDDIIAWLDNNNFLDCLEWWT